MRTHSSVEEHVLYRTKRKEEDQARTWSMDQASQIYDDGDPPQLMGEKRGWSLSESVGVKRGWVGCISLEGKLPLCLI
jgi:hypothetical protein